MSRLAHSFIKTRGAWLLRAIAKEGYSPMADETNETARELEALAGWLERTPHVAPQVDSLDPLYLRDIS